MWGAYKCNRFLGAVNPLAVTGLQSTRFDASPYMAAIGNLGKFGATFRLGTVFAPRQCLYQKEATGVGSLKMESLSRCSKPTGGYGPAIYSL